MIDWFLSLIPWWVWVVAAVAAVVVVWRTLGWQGALAALAAIVAVFGYGKGRQEGWNERTAAGRKEADNAITRADQARADSMRDTSSNGGKLRDDDGFRRD
jgi:hypothetical protein